MKNSHRLNRGQTCD